MQGKYYSFNSFISFLLYHRILNKQGAIIVYDIVNKQARRLLAGHPSVTAKNFKTVVNSTDFTRVRMEYGYNYRFYIHCYL